MTILRRWLVWLSRIHRIWGFGIQSPTDYAFVRSVVNEHWPYYAYGQLKEKNWLRCKLGRLYLRLANWRQPVTIISDDYRQWFQAGCRKAQFATPIYNKVELARIDIEDDYEPLLAQCDTQSVVVIEGIWRNWQQWRKIQEDPRTGTTFDLYYGGIVFFDKNRYKQHYIINF